MKRENNLIEKIADPDNLRIAFWKARKAKDGKMEVAEFRKSFDKNLLTLRNELLSGTLQVGTYHYFTIYDPKERIICAAPFQQRVLHHALMNVCHANFEKYQILDSYASRLGKGTYAALERASVFQKQYKWFLKLDIRKYFDSIDHAKLKTMLANRFKDKALLHIFFQIIDSYQTTSDKGLPIGNLTSQYFANHYLALADHHIKEKLQAPAYVRYMEDMVIWANDGKNHTQLCFEIDFEKCNHPTPSNVTYSKNLANDRDNKELHKNNGGAGLFGVTYKSNVWGYEEEVRLIVDILHEGLDYSKITFSEDGKYLYDKIDLGIITKVIFGYNSNIGNRTKIISYFSILGFNPEYEIMDIDQKTLEFKPKTLSF